MHGFVRATALSLFGASLALIACGDNKATIGIVEDTLDFGQTDCGATAIPRVLIVSNPTGTAFTFTTALAGGAASAYQVIPETASLLPNAQISVRVYSKAIPATSAVTDNLYGDTLTLTTDLPEDAPHVVAIKQTAHGAILKFSLASLDFPGVRSIGQPAQTSAVTIANSGNSPSTVTLKSTEFSFSFLPSGPQTIPGSSSVAGQISYAPKAIGAIRETLTLDATGPLCEALPTLEATGTASLAGSAKSTAIAVGKGRARSTAGGAITLCVLTTAGLVACSGSNEHGMRGAGTSFPQGSFNLVRTATGVLDNVVEVDGGRGNFCARRQTGDVWCWGDYLGLGRRGTNDPRSFNATAKLVASGTASVSAGYAYTCMVGNPGGVVSCSGEPNGGSSLPVGDWTLGGATAVSSSGGGGYALLGDGTVMSFGENSKGERGNTDVAESPPSLVTGLTGITQVTAGGSAGRRSNRHGCARKDDGTAWCWGKNRHGELGDGTHTDNSVPVQVMVDATTPLASVSAVSAGMAHTCAISNGTVYCWGRGNTGALGAPTTLEEPFAISTSPAVTDATSITSESRATCAVLATGAVRCWGEVIGLRTNVPTAISAFEP
jgi:alpha-tubulin suppressor-like RCC1 family protein